jgi:hypothetical protein
MKQCPKCEKRYDDSWSFCLKDTTPLIAYNADTPQNATLKKSSKSKQVYSKQCPHCGNRFDDSWSVCLTCDIQLVEMLEAQRIIKEQGIRNKPPRGIAILGIVYIVLAIIMVSPYIFNLAIDAKQSEQSWQSFMQTIEQAQSQNPNAEKFMDTEKMRAAISKMQSTSDEYPLRNAHYFITPIFFTIYMAFGILMFKKSIKVLFWAKKVAVFGIATVLIGLVNSWVSGHPQNVFELMNAYSGPVGQLMKIMVWITLVSSALFALVPHLITFIYFRRDYVKDYFLNKREKPEVFV